MKIAVIGAGNVGKALGFGFAKKGHEVKFGLKESSDKASVISGDNISIGSIQEVVAFGDVVVFAVPYAAVPDLVKNIGSFGDKILVDCTNRVNATFDGLSPTESSGAEELAALTGSKRVVKAFNTFGFNIMENPNFNGQKATALYCGDDAEAKFTVGQLAADLGFEPEDAGPLSQSKWLEALAWLWISMSMKYGHGRDMAFVLKKR